MSRSNFVAVAILGALLSTGCRESSTSPREPSVPQSPNGTEEGGAGLAFRLSPRTRDSVAALDSAIATIRYTDGRTRSIRSSVAEVLREALGTVVLEDLPLEDCRIEIEFASRDGARRLRLTVQIHVDPSYDTTATRACDDDRILVDGSVQSDGALVLKPWMDAWIGRADNGGDNNNGLGSELRLWEGGSMGLLDFGDLASTLEGRSIASAELVLHGWRGPISIGDTTLDDSIQLGTIPRGWSEGNGHWYWFDGAPWNGYDLAYSDWPGFLPPDCARNPAQAHGVTWNDDGGTRAGFLPLSVFQPSVDQGQPHVYPTADQAKVVRLDVTGAIRAQISSGASLGFALRRKTSSTGPRESIAFYSKDHDPSVSPSLVVRFSDGASLGQVLPPSTVR